MSAFLTHGINTPLTYLKANLELMEYDIDEIESLKIRSELKESQKKIIQAVKEIEKIVNIIHSATKETTIKK